MKKKYYSEKSFWIIDVFRSYIITRFFSKKSGNWDEIDYTFKLLNLAIIRTLNKYANYFKDELKQVFWNKCHILN